MNDKTVVPDGMVLIDGKLEKKAKLELRHHLQNLLFNYMNYGYFVVSIYWYFNLCRRQIQKGNWHNVGLPVVMELFGDSPTACFDVLKSYGVYATGGAINWKVIWNRVNLRLYVLVAKSQWAYADNILAQTGGEAYQITDKPGQKRGQALPRPYSQRSVGNDHSERKNSQRSAQTVRRPAKLGKTYRG